MFTHTSLRFKQLRALRRTHDGDIVAKIVEVEAYKGSDDPSSHAYRGKMQRNKLMFGKAGFAYVYFIYGNHYCFNVTTEKEGIPGAALVRAVEIGHGPELARKNRKARSLVNLTNGPGKLTQALDMQNPKWPRSNNLKGTLHLLSCGC